MNKLRCRECKTVLARKSKDGKYVTPKNFSCTSEDQDIICNHCDTHNFLDKEAEELLNMTSNLNSNDKITPQSKNETILNEMDKMLYRLHSRMTKCMTYNEARTTKEKYALAIDSMEDQIDDIRDLFFWYREKISE